MDVGTFFHIFCGVDFEINTVKERKKLSKWKEGTCANSLIEF